MTDDKISNNEAVDAALHLDGDPQKVRAFYDEWASNYEIDINESGYSGPEIAAKLLHQFDRPRGQEVCYSFNILDAGCGTGLVGIELAKLGYECIDGFDLSDVMAQKAIETGSYREIKGCIDMMQAAQSYTPQSYAAVLSIGVFTLGHVSPQAMFPLVQLASPGGLLIVSTRNLYYDETDFQRVVDELIDEGELTLLKSIKDAPYNKDGLAHYWVFRK
jgi:predicted TPR repeat methyltransferase